MNGNKSHPEKMLAAERRERIVELVDQRSSVSIADLKSHFGISAVTARSDLSVLEEQGRLRKMYGGAVSNKLSKHVSMPKERMSINVTEKDAIARRAASLVRDGDSIAIDTGTTTFEFVRYLTDRSGLTIVTNDFAIAGFVERNLLDSELVVLGGTFRRGHRYTYGGLVTKALEELHFDKAFLATNSYLLGQGFMTEFEPVATVKAEIIAHSRHNFILMDSSKVGKNGFIRFSNIRDVDGIVMESDPGNVMAEEIASNGASAQLYLA